MFETQKSKKKCLQTACLQISFTLSFHEIIDKVVALRLVFFPKRLHLCVCLFSRELFFWRFSANKS